MSEIYTRTYAVPTRHAGTALNMVTRRVTSRLPFGAQCNTRVVGTNATNPHTHQPEVLVEMRGDSAAQSGMLAHFEWCGF